MNIIADESVDTPVVARLRMDGHTVISIQEESPGITDEAVLERANREGAVLLTADKDFGELVFQMARAHHGVVLLRIDAMAQQAKGDYATAVFQQYGNQFLGTFSVVAPGGVRIRPVTPPAAP
jgi:predicted nuclease of predicted toxin-antitoxin system